MIHVNTVAPNGDGNDIRFIMFTLSPVHFCLELKLFINLLNNKIINITLQCIVKALYVTLR